VAKEGGAELSDLGAENEKRAEGGGRNGRKSLGVIEVFNIDLGIAPPRGEGRTQRRKGVFAKGSLRAQEGMQNLIGDEETVVFRFEYNGSWA